MGPFSRYGCLLFGGVQNYFLKIRHLKKPYFSKVSLNNTIHKPNFCPKPSVLFTFSKYKKIVIRWWEQGPLIFSFNEEILCQITTADSRWKHYSIISCFIDRIRYQPASIFIISKAFKKPLSNLSEFLTETSCIMLAASLILRCRKTDEHLRDEFWKMPLCISSRFMLICFS